MPGGAGELKRTSKSDRRTATVTDGTVWDAPCILERVIYEAVGTAMTIELKDNATTVFGPITLVTGLVGLSVELGIPIDTKLVVTIGGTPGVATTVFTPK